MTVPSSGQVTIRGLASEKKNGTYDESAAVTGPISLYDLFIGGNAHGSGESWDTTNTLSTDYPKPVTESEFIQGTDMPMGMDEWHSYDHEAGDSCQNYYSISLHLELIYANKCEQTKPALSLYVDSAYWDTATKLLRDSGSGNCINANSGWYYCPSGCSYAGATKEVRYFNGSTLGTPEGC